jgi:transcriptional regulator with XRE-family HTH domain
MILTLNEKLRELRTENNLSQEKVAELVCVSRQSVSKWETGLSKPDTENLIRLTEIYHVSLDELIGASESVEQYPSQNVKPYIPKIVFLSYIVSFGAIIGYFCPPVSNVLPPYILWICMGFIGGIMLVLKNKKLLMKSDFDDSRGLDIA